MGMTTDLDTATLLRYIDHYGPDPYEFMTNVARWPAEIVLAAIQREVDAGLLDYGAAIEDPWLTEQGHIVMENIREGRPNASS